MKKKSRLLVVLLLFGSLVSGTSNGVVAEAVTIPAELDLNTYVRTDGALVVWTQRTGSGIPDTDVDAARLEDARPFPVASGSASQLFPDVEGDVVVWEETDAACWGPAMPPPPGACLPRVRGRRLSTGEVFEASTIPGRTPMLSGRWLLWRGADDRADTVYARDLDTLAAPVTLVQAGHLYGVGAFRNERLVWTEGNPNPQGREPSWEVWTTTVNGEPPILLAQGPPYSGVGPPGYDIAGQLIVMDAGPGAHGVVAIDPRTGTFRRLAPNGQLPSSDGRYVFYQRAIARDDLGNPRRFALGVYDLLTNSLFDARPDIGWDVFGPYTKGGVVVWRQPNDNHLDLQAARIADVLPSARRSDPGGSGPNRRYFPETGHALAFGFKGFWEESGGLPVFGYPLTEEFGQRKDDLGNTWTVQYVERQRFEYHPELAGTPYEVELGLLGVDDARGRGLLGTGPFREAAAAPRPTCMFFAETKHNVCAPFYDYWSSHGLEFGDPGTSYREALALFGFPISEPFTDPSTGLTTQYFERARFEHHPENPGPYQVLLGRVGASLLTGWGWLPPTS